MDCREHGESTNRDTSGRKAESKKAPGRSGCCGSRPAGRVPWVSIVVGSALLLAALAAVGRAGLFDKVFGKSPAHAAKAAGVIETADEVKIPLKALDAGKALFLVMPHDGRDLFYFALKRADGQYRAALDACDVCFRMNRGYRQEGDLLVCNNCGQTFPSVRIGEVKGGCNPHPLPSRVDGAYLVVRKGDIAAGRDFFVRKRA